MRPFHSTPEMGPSLEKYTPDHSQAKILLVDDRPANLLAMEAILTPLGVTLLKAGSGREALDLVEKQEFALILMDVRMPEMDGIRTVESIARIRGTAVRIPIIFLTAAGVDTDEMRAAYARGAVDFLQKPFDPEILRSKVSVFVDLYLKEQTIRQQAVLLHRREIERFQRRNDLRYRALTDAMPQCVWVARSNSNVYYCNQHSIDYTGIAAASDLLDRVVHPDDREQTNSEWRDAREQRRSFEVKVRLRRHDGEYLWHLLRGVPELDEADNLAGWIATATDIDREYRALEQSETVSRAKDEFLATISHELRNPLNAIMGWAHLMRTGNLDDQRRARALETIERNARLQTALIEDLLDVSRISRGKISLKFRAVSLAAIVDSAVSAIRPTADAKGVQLDLQCRELDVVVNADPDRLQQIVWNLVSNAIKFTASGGRVDVTVWREGQELKLAVRDTGQGIRDEFLPYVFEPFRQGESGTMRSQQGLGLGLAIVKQLAELHGGRVVARSDGEGKGATFEVTLPSPESQSLEGVVSSPQQTEDNSLAGVDVLVVDDEPDSRMLLAELLDSYGMSVSLAASAREALSAIESKPPAVLLSDIGMPGEDGYSLIQKIRSLPSDRGGKMLAIALTGYGGTSDGERALKSGFEKVIVKPVEPDLLIEALRVLVLKGGDPKEEPARLRKI